MTYRQAEDTEFPAVSDDEVWCSLRGTLVGVSTCATGCVAPEQRPVCWNGRLGAAVADLDVTSPEQEREPHQ